MSMNSLGPKLAHLDTHVVGVAHVRGSFLIG